MSHAIVPAAEILRYLLSRPNVIVLALLLSGLLYWLRGVRPFIYGLIEMLVGSATIAFVVGNPGDLNAKLITIGIYIIIRGMDNIERDLPATARPLWTAIFPKRVL